jgi:hypothetical protein
VFAGFARRFDEIYELVARGEAGRLLVEALEDETALTTLRGQRLELAAAIARLRSILGENGACPH